MEQENLYQKALELTDRAFSVSSGLDLPSGDSWHVLVTVSLVEANERLDSIKVLLAKNYWNDAVILARALFELAVNLAYIDRNRETLQEYLEHAGIPTTPEGAAVLQEKLATDEGQQALLASAPKKAWKSLWDMCEDLGSGWVREYYSFYRFASYPTHHSGVTLGTNYLRLLNSQPPTESEKAKVLLTALLFHLRAARVAAKTFPEEIDSKRIEQLQRECGALEAQLLRLNREQGSP